MAKYRKKPIVIEAIQWTGSNLNEIKEFVGEALIYDIVDTAWKVGKGVPRVDMQIKTPEGNHECSKGDYIIKGIKGEFYPCKPDIFEATYEKVNDENTETITKETSLNVIVKSLVEGANSFVMKCPTCGRQTISSQQIYIHDNVKMEWYCRNCGQKLNNHNLVK